VIALIEPPARDAMATGRSISFPSELLSAMFETSVLIGAYLAVLTSTPGPECRLRASRQPEPSTLREAADSCGLPSGTLAVPW
jgi:hypothetical protein